MKTAKSIELTSGIATMVVELVTEATLVALEFSGKDLRAWIEGALLFSIAPGLLVACGSYLHAIHRKTVGLVMLLVGALFLTVMMFVYAFGGIFYRYGLWGFGFLIPSFLAIASSIAALLNTRRSS
jgi:hypothetical protein